jgi:hypothetical protein
LITGEKEVIAHNRHIARTYRAISDTVSKDRALCEGLLNWAKTIERACDEIESLSPNGQCVLGLLSAWHSQGVSGLIAGLEIIVSGIGKRQAHK